MLFVAESPKPSTPDARRADREIRGYLAMRTQRRRVYPRAALLGLVTGALAVAFHWCLGASAELRLGLGGASAWGGAAERSLGSRKRGAGGISGSPVRARSGR